MPRKAQTESVSDLNAAPGGAAAVDRALSLLSAFQPGDEALSLAQFAERTQLYKSTVLRLLASLEHARLIRRQDDGRYALGMEIARLHGLYAGLAVAGAHRAAGAACAGRGHRRKRGVPRAAGQGGPG
jgi:DNA-binding IscR family transcriptional regulator